MHVFDKAVLPVQDLTTLYTLLCNYLQFFENFLIFGIKWLTKYHVCYYKQLNTTINRPYKTPIQPSAQWRIGSLVGRWLLSCSDGIYSLHVAQGQICILGIRLPGSVTQISLRLQT